MLFKKLKKSELKKILVFTLTNIGDVILTFPVIDILREECPGAELSVVVAPKGESIIKNNPHFKEVFVFNKHQFFTKTCKFILDLRSRHYDLVVDLRNTAIPFCLGAKYTTPPYTVRDAQKHMRLQHLKRLKTVFPYASEMPKKYSLFVSDRERKYVDDIVKEEIGDNTEFVVVAPSAEDRRKRWHREGFADLCDQLIELYGYKIVFAGKKQDWDVVEDIAKKMQHESVNLTGMTTLTELARLLQRSCLAIANDSGPMHMASYLDVPIVALFGRSDPALYGPWGKTSFFVKADQSNVTEEQGESCFMKSITTEHVLETIKEMKKYSALSK